MRIFLAGATGALGRPLTRELVRRGHDVDGIARTPEAALALGVLGARAHAVDLFDADALAEAAAGADAVVHAAAATPSLLHAAADWERHDRLLREGTRNLVQAAWRAGAERFVQQSAVWVARPQDGAPFDEDTPPGPEPTSVAALDAEGLARDAGLDAVVLRCGSLYGPQARSTRTAGEALRDGRLPIVGHADAPLAFLHTDDAAAAFADAVEAADAGVYHVVDDEPASMADFLATLAALLGAPPPTRIAPWRARLRLGRESVELLTTPTRTGHERFTAATGWRPRFPTLREGLSDVVAEWREEDFLVTGAGPSTSASLRSPSA